MSFSDILISFFSLCGLTLYLYISIPYFFALFESFEFELSDVVDNVK